MIRPPPRSPLFPSTPLFRSEPPHPALTRRQLVLGVLRILHEPLGASGALLQRGGLERDGLELRELGPHGVVPCRVVAGGPRRQPAPQGACPPARAPQLPPRAIR